MWENTGAGERSVSHRLRHECEREGTSRARRCDKDGAPAGGGGTVGEFSVPVLAFFDFDSLSVSHSYGSDHSARQWCYFYFHQSADRLCCFCFHTVEQLISCFVNLDICCGFNQLIYIVVFIPLETFNLSVFVEK